MSPCGPSIFWLSVYAGSDLHITLDCSACLLIYARSAKLVREFKCNVGTVLGRCLIDVIL